MLADRVRIFDTTLRDGEQSPGATLTSAEKLEIARALSLLGVDVIEAGFPAASPDDLRAVQTIAEKVGGAPAPGRDQPPIICGLARATPSDIDAAWEAVAPARRPRIHTFLATSPVHREHKLRMTCAEILERIAAMVGHAASLCDDVEFSPEDAGRTEPEFLHQAVAAAIDAGATTVNIPDTVGYTTPAEFGALIAELRANVPDVDRAVVSVHCHDDLGMATANTLAGVAAGARQVEVTINGIGERAGNTALEEVVMALATREPLFGLTTGVDSRQLSRVSRLVSTVTGIDVQPNKAIVGANAFAHESGIHQDGMLKHAQTYEIMQPSDVGVAETRMVLGKHSGRHALGNRLDELGYPVAAGELDEVFAEFKRVADRKKVVTDADLIALVSAERRQPPQVYALRDLQVGCGTAGVSTAAVVLRGPDGVESTRAAFGSGPVDACFKAVDEIVGAGVELLEYRVHAVTEGIDALGEVSVRVRDDRGDRVCHGHGADTDIVVASARAYLAAINRLLISRGGVVAAQRKEAV